MRYPFNSQYAVAMFSIKLCLYFIFNCTMISCNNHDAQSRSNAMFPAGKWKAVSIQDKYQTLVFDTNWNYFLEIDAEKRMTVSAEDNTLSGKLNYLLNDSLTLQSIEISDVCCNSDTADILFHYFSSPVKYLQYENRLTLTSEKGILELKK